MRTFLTSVLLVLIFTNLLAQTDSVKVVDNVPIQQKQNWYKTKYIQESIVPLALIAGSLTILAIPNLKVNLQNKLNWNNQNPLINPSYIDLGDDYVRYAPTVAAYALSICGLKSKHRFIDRTAVLAVAYIASDFVVNNTKKIAQEQRPDKTENTSMPSQHTAMAFVAASFLDHELGYISPWISAGGYAVASYVGYARVARNAHFTCDVLMGAAVGIIMTNATYWAYDGVMQLFPEKLTISPIVDLQQTGVYICYKF
ncbi:MAG: phosphatase PAP2 family protein [Paludibacter sp.]